MILSLFLFIPETEANPYAVGGHWWYADSARSTGAKWLRMWRGDGGAVWGDIQPVSLDSFVWDDQDRWIRWADSCGFNIMLTVRTNKCKWVDTTHIPELDSLNFAFGDVSYPPKNYQDWYNFVYAVASRYDGNTPDPLRPGKFLPEVRYYETQAEPDWGYWYGTKEAYFDLFVPTFVRAVRDANPNAVIIGPSFTGYGIALAAIQEMVDSGIDTSVIIDFYRTHLEYDPEGYDAWGNPKPVNWDTVQAKLNDYTNRWAIRFVQYSYKDSSLYDKRGFHDYESWRTSPILIDYEKRWMAHYGYSRPLWWTELGHFDYRWWTSIPQPEAAARTWKKIINGFSSGVEWICYSVMLQPALILPLYASVPWDPNQLYAQDSKFSFAFLASKINEETGFRFSGSDTISHSYLFWFKSDTLTSFILLSAWADSGITDTIKVPVPPGTQWITLYNYLGRPVGDLTFSDSVELVLTWQPVMVEFCQTTRTSEGLANKPFTATSSPNPGTGGIGLSLILPAESDVILRLYDPTGRLVLTNDMGRLGPGEHRAFIPAKPGVYFLEAEAGGYRRVLKAVAK